MSYVSEFYQSLTAGQKVVIRVAEQWVDRQGNTGEVSRYTEAEVSKNDGRTLILTDGRQFSLKSEYPCMGEWELTPLDAGRLGEFQQSSDGHARFLADFGYEKVC